jgi:hypothetical protein
LNRPDRARSQKNRTSAASAVTIQVTLPWSMLSSTVGDSLHAAPGACRD